MGIYLRYSAAVVTLFLAFATASTAYSATLHPVPGIAKALAAGPSGVMPSGLTVQRSQQLGVMLLKSQVQLALGGGSIVPVTRGASLSVGALAKGAVTLIKNGNPGKLIGGAVITGAIALIPGAEVREGELILAGEGDPLTGTPGVDDIAWAVSGTGLRRYNPQAACEAAYPLGTWLMHETAQPPTQFQVRSHQITGGTDISVRCAIYANNQALGALRIATVVRLGTACPAGSDYSTSQRSCVGRAAPVPFTSSDWDDLEAAIPASDPSPDAVRDIWFDLCGGNGGCMGSYTSDPTLSGPSSVQGPKTTTTSTGPNGTTTTTKDTQHDIDYSNPDGIVVRDRTTTTTTNPDGSTNTDTTTDTGPVVVAPPAQDNSPDLDGSFSDTPFPEVTPFYEQKYPEGLEGVWSARKAEFEDSAFIDFLHSFVPSFSGSCPAWSINVNVASWAAFGIHDFQTLCWVFDFVKVVMLVTAAFLCRSLIFGG